MPTQFEQVMVKLERMERTLVGIYNLLHRDHEGLFEDDWGVEEDESWPDTLSEEADRQAIPRREPLHEPRTSVEVKAVDGEDYMMDWNDLDPRIQEAVDLSRKQGAPYQVFEDGGGRIRIMADNAVMAELHRKHTPMPRGGDK